MTRLKALEISQWGSFGLMVLGTAISGFMRSPVILVSSIAIAVGWLFIWDIYSDHCPPDFPTPKYTFEEKVLRKLGIS